MGRRGRRPYPPHAHAEPWAWHPADLPYLLGGGLLSSWMPNAERIPRGMWPGKDSGPSGRGMRPGKDSGLSGRGMRPGKDSGLSGDGPTGASALPPACPRKAVGMAPGGGPNDECRNLRRSAFLRAASQAHGDRETCARAAEMSGRKVLKLSQPMLLQLADQLGG